MKTITLTLTLITITLASCSGIREKTWPVEMAVFGSVKPWGEKESHQEQLQRVYAEAWNEGFLRGYAEGKDVSWIEGFNEGIKKGGE